MARKTCASAAAAGLAVTAQKGRVFKWPDGNVTREGCADERDLSKQFMTSSASFPLDSVCGKPAGKIANHKFVTWDNAIFVKCETIVKCPDHNHMATGLLGYLELPGPVVITTHSVLL